MDPRERASGPVGQLLAGKYVIEQVIGAGGMGVVYAARHIDLHELYAIKVMRPPEHEDADHTTADERFLREARACARLRGEHVAKVHDVGRLEDGTPFMVMEHLTGLDLRKLFKQRGALPVDDVIDYVLQACEAISEAHALGIVHRDLKPANLFLAERPGAPPTIKVLDFGISKQTGPNKDLDVTNTTDMLGSPYYMAPEQMRSGRSADARSDIWSLGVCLYELTGGALPFAGKSITEVCARVLQDRPAPLVARVPGVNPAFDQVVMRCLEKEPDRRYQSAAELAAALRAVRGIEGRAPDSTARPLLPSRTDPRADTGAHATLGSTAPNATWGTTTAATPHSSWTGLRIAVVAVLCTAAGALGVAAFGLVHGGDRPAPAGTTETPAQAPSAAPSPTLTAALTAAPDPSGAPSAAPTTSAATSAGATAKTKIPVPVRTTQPKGPKVVDFGDRQ